MNSPAGRVLEVLGALLVWFALVGSAQAHPLSQGALDVVIYPDHLSVRARITVEEAVISGTLAGPADLTEARRAQWHAHYLLEHLHASADGMPLIGRVAAIAEPGSKPEIDDEHLVYDYVYAPAEKLLEPLTNVELRQDVLVGVELAPGVNWDASYTVRIASVGGIASEGLLLTSKSPLVYRAQGERAWVSDYLVHGIQHILSGYDHLLFISALVLASLGLWDLIKVVSAFTLAHMLTLTLAALRLVDVPSSVVEPLIAASIVFVAAQNLFWPKQARGGGRLAVAFGFGLCHGLGFAGGLLDAMQGMAEHTMLLAIAAFSLGVEIGHQLVVIPLFAVLKLASGTASGHDQPGRVRELALRYGAAAIGIAGFYYLVVALRAALG